MLRTRITLRGLTLAEVVVASAVMIFVTFAATTLLVGGLAAQASQLRQGDLQRGAAGALSRLCDELSEGSAAAVRVESSASGVVFASPRNALGEVSYASDGRLLWCGFICYCLESVNGRSCMVRRWSPLAPPVSDPPAVPASMTCAWFRLQPLPRLVVGSDVSVFTLSGTNPLQITVTAALEGRHDLTIGTSVLLRN